MTYLLNTLDIIIIHREKGGKPDFIYPYNGNTATHVTGCANLARAILATERGEHPISLNAARIRDMCTAGRMATANPNKNSKDHQRYRRFVFNIATSMVHEFGHMFITFLAQGRSDTPRSMAGKAKALKGEAGDELEHLLFGGINVATRNTDEDEAQSGDPHLLKKVGGLCTITQETVDKTVRYEFDFPLPTIPTVDPRKKKTLGRLLPLPGNNLSSPMSWPQTMTLFAVRDHYGATINPFNFEHVEALAELLAKNANPRNLQSGPSSAIYRLPFNPGLTPEPVKPEEVKPEPVK